MRTIRKSNYEILICSDAAELAREAARRFAELAEVFTNNAGRFTAALSGGSTPKAKFQILAEKPYADSLPWRSIYFFWGDERCVPPDHQDSNYRMANETLLSKVQIPRENIFRIPAEDEDHDRAAASYSDTVRTFFGEEPPGLDLVFLGMGPDGHTASLFPGTAALRAGDRIAVANFVEKFQSWRITLTADSINRARNIIFLVAGPDKAPALKEVIEGPRNPEQYPSQLIQPSRGALLWMVDEAAANLLSG
ncbi:MAG TPA: 6-phosphogluconolactonase [Blastocatellia bacterium]|jgi:6-phosphogluconolactonase|nr:6-phosphogluconolactonase [Blastocatellia bacterium]